MEGIDMDRVLPRIRRARDFRLYTGSGGRLLDLWQYGGTAILGHTPPGLLRELKNTASRGLFAPLPSFAESRFHKALALLFPGRVARLYPDEASLRAALAAAGYAAEGPFPDPAFGKSGPPGTGPWRAAGLSLWRPFLADPEEEPSPWFQDIPLLIPVLPLPWPGAPRVLILEPSRAAAFPSPGPLSPLVLAAGARSVHDLIAALPGRSIRAFPRLRKALAQGGWRRRGIYLSWKEIFPENPDQETYAAMFRRFLDAGFLLPPARREPLILPGALSPGEEAKLARLLLAGADKE
jgi:hypothetical protein